MSTTHTEPLRFASWVDALSFLEAHFADWADELTADEHDALSDYKASRYSDLNQGLREGWYDETDENVALIDSAIAKGRLQVPVVAYRGFVGYGIGDALDSVVGATIDEEHFSSTSLVSLTAEGFLAGAEDDEDAVLGEFVLPAGLNVAPLDLVANLHESELLLPRGTQFFVAEVDPGSEYPLMKLRWRP